MNDLQVKMLIKCKKKARDLGGKCLSSSYVSGRKKLKWWCKYHNHCWLALPDNVLNKSAWCRQCANEKLSRERRGSFAGVKSGAKKARLRILSNSDECRSNRSHLKVKCLNCTKVYLKNVEQIRKASVCKYCRFEKSSSTKIARSKNRVAEVLKVRNIQLKSGYRGLRSPALFVCLACRWEWRTAPYNIVSKKETGCPKCAAKLRAAPLKIGIERMRAIAKERGGHCLSAKYESNSTPLDFVCKFGHHWRASAAPILNGSWCPECSSGLGERLCRTAFEQIFGRSFPKCRPHWLKGRKGRLLELDGYCEEINVAFEHHGEHHYRQSYFSNTSKIFGELVERDKLKAKTCAKYGVRLVIIPEVNNLLPLSELKQYIIHACRDRGIKIPRSSHSKVLNFRDAYCPDRFTELGKIVAQKGGHLISTTYLGVKVKHEVECLNGHKLWLTPDALKRGSWCRVCKGFRSVDIEVCRSKAILNGGQLLSRNYKGNRIKMKWQCKEGHIFMSDWHAVGRGSWCRICRVEASAAKLRDNIEMFRQIVAAKGGKCLSNEYKNQSTRIKVQCGDCDFIWDAYPASLKQGRWCQRCAWIKNGSKRRKRKEPPHRSH